MIFSKRKNNTVKVVVYSAGSDGSAAVFESLSQNRTLNVRQVYTLDPAKINALKNQDGDKNIPAHIMESERILTGDMAQGSPCHFITLLRDPFSRHVAHCFQHLKSRVDGDALADVLSDKSSISTVFYSLPVENSASWFEHEFLPATGIDVYKHGFRPEDGFQIHIVGKHRFLLLSDHLGVARKTKIIARFLRTDISPLPPEAPAPDPLKDLLAAQVYTHDSLRAYTTFWQGRQARFFFTAAQREAFQDDAVNACQRALGPLEDEGTEKPETTRAQILRDAVLRLYQVPRLQTDIAALTRTRGVTGSAAVIESLLRQMDKARNNLLLAGMRAIAGVDVQAAITLGQDGGNPPRDARVIKSLATYLQRQSAITAPLALLETLDTPDEKTALCRADLASRARLLQHPFPFAARADTSFTPHQNRVLYVPHQCLPFHTSGYATRTQGIVKGLTKNGWDVHVFARPGYPTDTGVEAMGLTRQVIDCIPYHFLPDAGLGQHDMPLDAYIDRAARYIENRAREVRPQIIHAASNYLCGLAGVEAARRLGLPSVYEMRGLWHITRWSKEADFANTDRFALADKLELEAAAGADHVLAITGALKEWLVERGIAADKISIAPNAVDLTQFTDLPYDHAFAQSAACAGKIVIGYIGSFVQYEGLDLLVEAVALLPEALRTQIKLLWIGDGPVLPALLTQAQALGVADCITSLGRRPFEEVPRAYSIVDISAFPRKGQVICEIVSPLKPFEAMAMRKAVIVSDVRPLKEIITHEVTGLIHEKDNAQSLSAQLARFIADAPLRQSCGQAARQWVEDTRQWDITAQNIAQAYEGLV